MKLKILVDGAGVGPSGSIDAFFPGDVITIDDGNADAVAWARVRVDTGFAELVQDVAPTKSSSKKES